MGIVHSPNMHNMYVALLVLCCSLGFSEVSAVKFEEFLGYPFGELYGYSAFPPSVDRVRGVTIPTPFTFFGQIYNFANIDDSGYVSFINATSPVSTPFTPMAFPFTGPVWSTVVAAFWADADTSSAGTTYYKGFSATNSTDQPVLSGIDTYVHSIVPELSGFQATWALIVTWEAVGYYSAQSNLLNTFQLVVATDGVVSLAIFNYAEEGINWVTSNANGGTNGFGGIPAIAGYNAGDGIRSFTIPGSMTDDIQFIDSNTGNTGNIGQWVFRIDSEQPFTFVGCQGSAFLSLSPSVGHVFGGTPVVVSGLCINPPHQDITCVFDREAKPGTYLSSQRQFLCIAPAMKQTGRVEFKMMVKDADGQSHVTVASFFYVSYNRGHKVQMSNCQSSVVKDSCIALGSGRKIDPKGSVTLQWDNAILPYENASSYKVDIVLYEVNTATNSLSMLRTLHSDVANSGAMTVTIPERVEQTQFGRIRDAPAIAAVFKVAAKSAIPLQQAGVWTGVTFLAGKSPALRLQCRQWNNEDDGVVNNGVLPCPPMANQARLPNSGLMEESYESIHGATTYHQQFISTFHPGAESCFRQRERLLSGAGTQCCYDTDGVLMVDQSNGGSIDKSAPVDYNSSIRHIQDDLLPFIFCCTSKRCNTYYRNRPPITDVGWNPPVPACIYGDPHIVTLDGHKYTFNGKGEFTLIETDDGSFTLQGRMAEATDAFGQGVGATVFTSLVVKELDSDTVQVDLTPDGLVALVNGEEADIGNMTEQEFDNVLVENGANQSVIVTFASGAFIEVRAANDIISTMVVSLPTVMQGLTRGLMGNYNGNITDDLQSRNGNTTLSLNSSLEVIHYSFGVTWIVDSANDSLFSYGANESWSDFYSPDFAPIFEVDFNSSSISVESFDICEGDLFCIFDIAATGNMAIGLTTLSGGQELEMINTLSAPVVCDPPCGMGVCMPNNTCQCPAGYIGENCSTPVFEPCVDNICENNATCIQHVETVTCECPEGYESSLCEEPICSPPCVAGFCAEIDLCECVTGYTGSTCSIAVPTLPLNVTVEELTNTSFTVTWQPPTFPLTLFGLIEYYEIEIDPTIPGLMNTSANVTMVTFNDLLPGTNYTVRVRAHTSVGGPFTEPEVIQTLLEPSIPVNLTVTSTGSTSIFVLWQPPLQFVGDILYYEITFRGIESPNQINSTFYQTSNLFSIVTSVQINSNYGIMPFSTYNVSARAVNEVGPGPFSNEVLVQTVADAPSPPERLQPLTISARNITVTWDPPLNPNGIISIYQIELMSEDGNITQQNTTQAVAVFTGLTPRAPYSIKVQAFTVEFGDFGPVLMVSTLPVSPEGLVYVMPQNVTADAGCSVAFMCMTTGGPGNTFQWSHNGQLLQGQNGTMLMLSDVSAESGGYYTCQVTNDAGNGSDFGIAFINPVFLEDPMPVTVIFDGSGNMSCTAKGFPAPTIIWMFGGAPAEHPVVESYIPGDALAIVSVLLFSNVTYDSLGNYTCVARLPFIASNDTTSVTSMPAFLLVQGVPESPFNVTALETTSSSIFLTWLEPFDNNAPILRYVAILSDSSNGEMDTYTVEGKMEVANISGLRPFTMYTVRVIAVNSVGQGSPSELQLVTTDEDVPSQPLNVTVANKTSTALLVTWLLPEAPNGVLTSYEIRYMGLFSVNPVPMSFYRDLTAIVPALQTFHEIKDLVPSTNYAILVRAFTGVGAGQYSETVIGGTEEDVPSSPLNVTNVDKTSTTLSVTWLPPSIPNGVLINYEVIYTGITSVNLVPMSFFEPRTRAIPTNETSIVLLDLVPYSDYTITVRASTSAGPGEYSEEINDRTEEDVPASPLNVAIVNRTSTTQLVTWLPPSMPNGVLTSYEVTYIGDFSANPVPASFFQPLSITVSAPNTSLVLQQLVPYSTYTISVRAFTSAGPGEYSEGIENRTEEDVPSVPLNVTVANMSSTTLLVTWLSPTIPNGILTTYEVTYTGVSSLNPVPTSFYQPLSITISAPNTSLVVPGLVPHSNYTISVRAFTSAGPGEVSVEIEERTDEDVPSPPLSVTVADKTSTTLLVTWLPPATPNGVLTSYEVYYKGVSSVNPVPASFYQPLSVTVSAPNRSLVLSGLLPYSNYTITVRAFTSAGAGEVSEEIEDRTEEDVPVLGHVNATTSHYTIFLQWTLLFPNGAIRYYIVEISSNDGSVNRSLMAQNTNISIDSLPPAMIFTIQVCGFTIACGDNFTVTTATTGVRPEVFTQGGVKTLKSSRDDSVVVAFIIAQAVPPATREQISWVFTSSTGETSLPCANTSEYTFSEDCLSLHILHVAHKHGGKYQLFARTRAGMGSQAVTLVVTGVPPHILSPLQNITTLFIKNLTLVCTAAADPAPVLVWRFGAQRVSHDNDKYIISTNSSWSSLTVTKLGVPDGGIYMCSASNRYGTESTTAHVTIQVPPTLLLYPSSTRSVSSGGEFTATCVATAEPPASIVWLKEGEMLPNGIGNVSELTQGNTTTSRLVFGSFTPADSALYSCMAGNFLGNDTASFFVSTRGNQTITMIELASGSSTSSVLDADVATVEELNDLNVSCTARGSPPLEVMWLKNGALLQPQNGTRRRIQLTQTDRSGTATLHVSELLLTDAGMYTCIVLGSGISSLQGETAWSFQLNVNAINDCIPNPCDNGGRCIDTVEDYICQCQNEGSVHYTGRHCQQVANVPSTPAIITNPENQRDELEAPVILTCEAGGSPMPVIRWFKDGVQLRGPGAFGSMYVIPELGLADRGSYHCEASNGFGDPVKSSEATVLITGIVQMNVELVQQAASTGRQKRQSEPAANLVQMLDLLAVGTRFILDSGISAVVLSVEEAIDGTIVFTLSTNSSQPPGVVSGLVVSPLERLLQEYSDILPGLDFEVNAVQRHDGCPSVVDSSCSKGSITVWPETEIGETVTVPCPCGSPRSSLLPELKATRSCGGSYDNGAQWENALCGECQFHDARFTLCELSQTDSPSLLGRLLAMTSQDASIFSSDDVLLTAMLLHSITVSVPDISMEQVQRDVLLTISNILGTQPEEVLKGQQNAMSSTRLLQVVQTVLESVETVPFIFSAPYLGVIVEDVGDRTNQTFMANLTNLVATVANKTEMLPNVSSAELVSSASASLSPTIVAHGSRVAATLFTHDILFQQRPNFTRVWEEERKQVGSVVMQVTIVGSLVTGISNEDRAIYTFVKTETAREFGERPACQTWNFTLDDEYGAWSNDDCVVTSDFGDELQCACTSLAYTTVRFDIVGEHPQANVRWVAVIGPSIAIICIGLTLVLYLSNRNLRSSTRGSLLMTISLLLALCGLFVSYIVAAVSLSIPALCATASASVHYFLLATFCWKLVEAIAMYRKTARLPKPDKKYGLVISSLVSWLSPAVIVALSIAPRYQNYINPLFCHSYGLSFWLGMVLPLSVICGATWTTFGLTLPHFVLCSWNKKRHAGGMSEEQRFWSRVFFTAIVLSLLLGVVWITGCLVLLSLPMRSQTVVDLVFTLLATAYGATVLTGHCLRALCHHSPEEGAQGLSSPKPLWPWTKSAQKSSTTRDSVTPTSTLGSYHSRTGTFSSSPGPRENEMNKQDIAMIENPAVTTDSTLDTQSLHITFGAGEETHGEVRCEADTNTEENATSPSNWKVHGDCVVMENKMEDDDV